VACGKLVVASGPDEEATLAGLAARAARNGVENLRMLTGAEATAMEPALRCDAALLSSTTGIVDSAAYMLALRGEAEEAGAIFAFNAPVSEISGGGKAFVVHTAGQDATKVECTRLVNAAGLGAVALARRIAGLDTTHVPAAYLSKGNYFGVAGKLPFRHLIYPVPIPGGAGIHLTFDLGGRGRFGPDVEPVKAIDYTVDPRRAEHFYAAIRRYWPALPDNALVPDYAGIRPKIVPPDQMTDFVIQDSATHGLQGLINLFGIESPGLTSSLAIADAVGQILV
jgi:L-2-hydroxyglutarate oxidase LhgO